MFQYCHHALRSMPFAPLCMKSAPMVHPFHDQQVVQGANQGTASGFESQDYKIPISYFDKHQVW